MSELPSTCQGRSPICAAKVTRPKPPPGTSARTVTVPVEPSAGASRVIEGAAAAGASFPAALSTTEDSAGTVTVTLRSAPLVVRAPGAG